MFTFILNYSEEQAGETCEPSYEMKIFHVSHNLITSAFNEFMHFAIIANWNYNRHEIQFSLN
jgi:hypothetical protein